MPLPNGKIGVKNNPLKVSPFVQDEEVGINFPPPPSEFLITDAFDNFITDSGEFFITD